MSPRASSTSFGRKSLLGGRYDTCRANWLSWSWIFCKMCVKSTTCPMYRAHGLHQEIEFATGVDDDLRSTSVKCQRSLWEQHNVIPTSFHCHDVCIIGSGSVAGGGFSDIWKGTLYGEAVCLKVLRFFPDSQEKEKLWAVSVRHAFLSPIILNESHRTCATKP